MLVLFPSKHLARRLTFRVRVHSGKIGAVLVVGREDSTVVTVVGGADTDASVVVSIPVLVTDTVLVTVTVAVTDTVNITDTVDVLLIMPRVVV